MKKILFLLSLSIALWSTAQNALDFDGTDDHVQTTFNGISGTNARTVEAWIKTTADYNPNNGGVQGVIVDWGTMTLGSRFTFNILWSNSIRIEVGGAGLSGTTAVNDGNWHHVAVVYNPSAAYKYKLYIDGSLEITDNISQSMNTTSTGVRIGRRVDDVKFFEGAIDEVRIWDIALSNADIAAYADSSFCNWPTGLVAYYDFNEGMPNDTNTGVTTLPELVSGANGTLNNFALTGTSSNWVNGVTGLNGGTPTDSSFSWTTCGPVMSPSGNHLWDTSGVYLDTMVNAAGCDSMLTVDLSILSINTTVLQNGNTLTADAFATGYQWLDCNNGYAPIAGATLQSYTASANGDYAVEIEINGCTDTSDCVTVSGIGIADQTYLDLNIYPNPVSDDLHIDFSSTPDEVTVILSDIQGRVLLLNEYEMVDKIILQVSSLSQGNYILEVSSANSRTRKIFQIK